MLIVLDILKKNHSKFISCTEYYSILDLILFGVCPNKHKILNQFNNIFENILAQGFSSTEFKREVSISCIKALNWFELTFEKLLFSCVSVDYIMGKYILSDEKHSIISSFLGNSLFNDKHKLDKNALFVNSMKLLNYINSLGLQGFKKNTSFQPYVSSGSWEVLCIIVSLLESFLNVHYDIFEKLLTGPTNLFVFKTLLCLKGIFMDSLTNIISIDDISAKDALLQTMEHQLFKNLTLIEELTKKLAQNETESQGYGPLRLGFIHQYTGILLFVKYFLKRENSQLYLKKEMISEKCQLEFIKNINMNEQDRTCLYTQLLKNYIFYLQRISKIKRKHEVTISVEMPLANNKLYSLFFNCLFYLDPLFKDILTTEIKLAFSNTTKDETFGTLEKYIRNIFYFLYEITLNENTFEEFFFTVNMDYSLKNKPKLSKKEIEHIEQNIPGLIERFKTYVKYIPNVKADNLYEIVEFPLTDHSKSDFIQFIVENHLTYNSKTRRFTIKDKNKKKVFLQNLFYTEEENFTKLRLNMKNQNKKIKEIGLFYWGNDRTPYAIDYLKSNGLCDWLVSYYYGVKSSLTKFKPQKHYKETDLIAEMILVYCQITENRNIISKFFEQIYKESGDELVVLIKSLIKKWDHQSVKSLNKLPSLSTTLSKKKKFNSLMDRIKKKARKVSSHLENIDLDSEIKSTCLKCSKPFTEDNPLCLITKFITYQIESLFEGREETNNGYHMMTTCGHQYHLFCVYYDSRGIQCPYCKKIGEFILPDNISNHDIEKKISYLKNIPKLIDIKASNLVEVFIFPILQTMRCIKLICTDRLNNNVIPVLRLIIRMIYSSADLFNFPSFCHDLNLFKESVATEISPLESDFTASFCCNLESLCSESLFGKVVLSNHLVSVKESGYSDHQRINQNMTNTIRDNLWKFVILCLLQNDNLTINLINEEMIIAQCFDLFHIVIFLEDCLNSTKLFRLCDKTDSFENRIRGISSSG